MSSVCSSVCSSARHHRWEITASLAVMDRIVSLQNLYLEALAPRTSECDFRDGSLKEVSKVK